MRIAILCAGAAIAVLALELQPAAERVTVPFSDPARPRALEVSVLNGSITVRAHAGTEAAIEMTPRGDGRRRGAYMDGHPGPKISERDNTVSVSSGPNSIDFLVQIPADTALRLNSVNGNISVEGVSGEIDANSVNGSITLNRVSGAVVTHSLNQDVNVTFNRVTPDKAMSFSTLNGSVYATLPADVKARVKFKTGRGELHSDFEIRMEPGAEPAMDKTIQGTINGGGPEMKFTTFNGNIHLRKRK